jgi:dihydrodipicolinate synthase/N-acetylneuraminate lyase
MPTPITRQPPFRGVFTIPCTPFTEPGGLDENSLRREIEFCIECGAHGLVAPVNASEFTSLSDEERQRVVEIVVRSAAGRVPVVAGVSAVSAEVAAMFARHAAESGAAALIAMPPYVRRASQEEIAAYYAAISEAAPLPIFIQNFVPPVGTPMSAAFMARLLREIEHVDYVKEETIPAPHVMTELIQEAGSALKGVMGGMAGRYLLNEYDRGACGTMPACEITDVHVQLWNALDSGDRERARAIYHQMLPLLNVEHLYGAAVYKEVLVRRGVIRSARMRGGIGPLDAVDQRELDGILAGMRDLFRVSPPARRGGEEQGEE